MARRFFSLSAPIGNLCCFPSKIYAIEVQVKFPSPERDVGTPPALMNNGRAVPQRQAKQFGCARHCQRNGNVGL